MFPFFALQMFAIVRVTGDDGSESESEETDSSGSDTGS